MTSSDFPNDFSEHAILQQLYQDAATLRGFLRAIASNPQFYSLEIELKVFFLLRRCGLCRSEREWMQDMRLSSVQNTGATSTFLHTNKRSALRTMAYSVLPQEIFAALIMLMDTKESISHAPSSLVSTIAALPPSCMFSSKALSVKQPHQSMLNPMDVPEEAESSFLAAHHRHDVTIELVDAMMCLPTTVLLASLYPLTIPREADLRRSLHTALRADSGQESGAVESRIYAGLFDAPNLRPQRRLLIGLLNGLVGDVRRSDTVRAIFETFVTTDKVLDCDLSGACALALRLIFTLPKHGLLQCYASALTTAGGVSCSEEGGVLHVGLVEHDVDHAKYLVGVLEQVKKMFCASDPFPAHQEQTSSRDRCGFFLLKIVDYLLAQPSGPVLSSGTSSYSRKELLTAANSYLLGPLFAPLQCRRLAGGAEVEQGLRGLGWLCLGATMSISYSGFWRVLERVMEFLLNALLETVCDGTLSEGVDALNRAPTKLVVECAPEEDSVRDASKPAAEENDVTPLSYCMSSAELLLCIFETMLQGSLCVDAESLAFLMIRTLFNLQEKSADFLPQKYSCNGKQGLIVGKVQEGSENRCHQRGERILCCLLQCCCLPVRGSSQRKPSVTHNSALRGAPNTKTSFFLLPHLFRAVVRHFPYEWLIIPFFRHQASSTNVQFGRFLSCADLEQNPALFVCDLFETLGTMGTISLKLFCMVMSMLTENEGASSFSTPHPGLHVPRRILGSSKCFLDCIEELLPTIFHAPHSVLPVDVVSTLHASVLRCLSLLGNGTLLSELQLRCSRNDAVLYDDTNLSLLKVQQAILKDKLNALLSIVEEQVVRCDLSSSTETERLQGLLTDLDHGASQITHALNNSSSGGSGYPSTVACCVWDVYQMLQVQCGVYFVEGDDKPSSSAPSVGALPSGDMNEKIQTKHRQRQCRRGVLQNLDEPKLDLSRSTFRNVLSALIQVLCSKHVETCTVARVTQCLALVALQRLDGSPASLPLTNFSEFVVSVLRLTRLEENLSLSLQLLFDQPSEVPSSAVLRVTFGSWGEVEEVQLRLFDVLLAICDYDQDSRTVKCLDDCITRRCAGASLLDLVTFLTSMPPHAQQQGGAKNRQVKSPTITSARHVCAIHLLGHLSLRLVPRYSLGHLVDIATTIFRRTIGMEPNSAPSPPQLMSSETKKVSAPCEQKQHPDAACPPGDSDDAYRSVAGGFTRAACASMISFVTLSLIHSDPTGLQQDVDLHQLVQFAQHLATFQSIPPKDASHPCTLSNTHCTVPSKGVSSMSSSDVDAPYLTQRILTDEVPLQATTETVRYHDEIVHQHGQMILSALKQHAKDHFLGNRADEDHSEEGDGRTPFTGVAQIPPELLLSSHASLGQTRTSERIFLQVVGRPNKKRAAM